MTKTTTKTKTTTTTAKAKTTTTLANPQNPDEARALGIDDGKYSKQYLNVISATGKKLRQLVQDAAIFALLRAYGHDNFDYVNKLHATVMASMSKSDADKLKVWFETYAPCVLRKVEDGHSFRKDKSKSANSFDFESAHANPWYDVPMMSHDDVQKLLSGANIQKRLENIIKTAEKAIENNEVEPNDVESIKATIEAIRPIAQGFDTASQAPANDKEQETSSEEKLANVA